MAVARPCRARESVVPSSRTCRDPGSSSHRLHLILHHFTSRFRPQLFPHPPIRDNICFASFHQAVRCFTLRPHAVSTAVSRRHGHCSASAAEDDCEDSCLAAAEPGGRADNHSWRSQCQSLWELECFANTSVVEQPLLPAVWPSSHCSRNDLLTSPANSFPRKHSADAYTPKMTTCLPMKTLPLETYRQRKGAAQMTTAKASCLSCSSAVGADESTHS